MTEECICKAEDVSLFPCTGGSNCGQITNRVAVSLDVMGVGHIYCLAGIGAHVDGMVESARGATRIAALDGCQVACAKKTIEHAGLTVTDWVCVTEEGISKSHSLLIDAEEVDLITRRTKELLSIPAKHVPQMMHRRRLHPESCSLTGKGARNGYNAKHRCVPLRPWRRESNYRGQRQYGCGVS